MRTAVVGHVEWIEFGLVDHVPEAGGIAHATEAWEEPGGAGSVAAVQLAKLTGSCAFFTALGGDELGARARRELERLGVRVEAAIREAPTRKAAVSIDRRGERTITTLGERLDPRERDPLPWEEMESTDAAYFTAGDLGALRWARRASILVATSRVLDRLSELDEPIDAVVGSARDPAERYDPSALRHRPNLVVLTDGQAGGTYETAEGEGGRFPAAPLPGPVGDTYGSGDSFAAGLTYALGVGYAVRDALGIAARCGAANVTGRGPFAGQLTAADLGDRRPRSRPG